MWEGSLADRVPSAPTFFPRSQIFKPQNSYMKLRVVLRRRDTSAYISEIPPIYLNMQGKTICPFFSPCHFSAS